MGSRSLANVSHDSVKEACVQSSEMLTSEHWMLVSVGGLKVGGVRVVSMI